jgi:hypothetical protein
MQGLYPSLAGIPEFVEVNMNHWAELEAEKIVDAFVAYEGPDDLLKLQTAIARTLFHFYELGRDQNRSALIEPSFIDGSE